MGYAEPDERARSCEIEPRSGFSIKQSCHFESSHTNRRDPAHTEHARDREVF